MFLCSFQRKICSFFFSDETSIPSGANLILGQLSGEKGWFWQAGDRKEEGAAVTPRTQDAIVTTRTTTSEGESQPKPLFATLTG